MPLYRLASFDIDRRPTIPTGTPTEFEGALHKAEIRANGKVGTSGDFFGRGATVIVLTKFVLDLGTAALLPSGFAVKEEILPFIEALSWAKAEVAGIRDVLMLNGDHSVQLRDCGCQGGVQVEAQKSQGEELECDLSQSVNSVHHYKSRGFI